MEELKDYMIVDVNDIVFEYYIDNTIYDKVVRHFTEIIKYIKFIFIYWNEYNIYGDYDNDFFFNEIKAHVPLMKYMKPYEPEGIEMDVLINGKKEL